MERNNSVNARLHIVRIQYDMKQDEFARELELNRTTISAMERGLFEPSNKTIDRACERFGVSKTWLLDGTGDPYIPAAEMQAKMLNKMAAVCGLKGRRLKFLEQFLAMSEQEQAAIIAYSEMLKNVADEVTDEAHDELR